MRTTVPVPTRTMLRRQWEEQRRLRKLAKINDHINVLNGVVQINGTPIRNVSECCIKRPIYEALDQTGRQLYPAGPVEFTLTVMTEGGYITYGSVEDY